MFHGYPIISGAVDLNFDGTINASDTTSTLAGHPQFLGFNVISGKIDLNGDGTINASDTGDAGICFACATPVIINDPDVGVTKVDNKGGSSTKTDGVTSVVPGTSTTYTIVVSNSGPRAAKAPAVSDPLPAGVTSFSWSGNGHTNVAGAISDTIASLAPGASVTYTVVAAISPSATGSLVNTVTVNTADDTNLANNSATDTDTLTPQNNESVTKVDNVGGSSITSSVGTVVPGTSLTYTITVSNSGLSTATSVAVSDPLPAGVTSFSWSGNGGRSTSPARWAIPSPGSRPARQRHLHRGGGHQPLGHRLAGQHRHRQRGQRHQQRQQHGQ